MKIDLTNLSAKLEENLQELKRVKHKHYVELKRLEKLEDITESGRFMLLSKSKIDSIINDESTNELD